MLDRGVGEGGLEVLTLKLIDFGYARSTANLPACSVVGTIEYVAPEIVLNLYSRSSQTPYDDRADVWSAGCIAYEMITGTRPFSNRTRAGGQDAVFQAAKKGDYKDPTVDRASTAFSTMLRSSMLVPGSLTRKHAIEVLQDPWFGLPPGAYLWQPIRRLAKIEVENTNVQTIAVLRDMLKTQLGASDIECFRCDHAGLQASYDATAKSSLVGGAEHANERVFFWAPASAKATAAVMIDAAENGIETCGGKLEFFASPSRGSCCVQRTEGGGKYLALPCKVMLGAQPVAASEGDSNNAASPSALTAGATSFYIGSGDARKIWVFNELVVRPYALFTFSRA